MSFLRTARDALLGNRGPAARTSIGMLDTCTSSFLSGWCCGPDRTPSPVDVLVNGERVLRITPNIRRDDLVAHGVDPESGFAQLLPTPLSAGDDVRLLAEDGRDLVNSGRNWHRERLGRLLDGIDVAAMVGLELGALDRPIVSKRQGDVRYVDHASRDNLRKKYAGTPTPLLFADRIVETDYVWAEGRLADRIEPGTAFDYCLAAHVMEHVANPIGWLRSICEVMKPGGIVALILPERSRSFDYRRSFTTPSDLIEADLLGLTRPSMRQVFDHVAFASPFATRDRNPPPNDAATLRTALLAAKRSQEPGAYVDAHCCVFDLAHFLLCWEVIDTLGLLPLTLRAAFEPYAPHHDEFIVTFSKRAS